MKIRWVRQQSTREAPVYGDSRIPLFVGARDAPDEDGFIVDLWGASSRLQIIAEQLEDELHKQVPRQYRRTRVPLGARYARWIE